MPRMLIDMHFGERGRLPRLLSAVTLDPDRLGVGIDENTAICVHRGHLRGARQRRRSPSSTPSRRRSCTPPSDNDPITLFDVRLHLLPAGCVFDLASTVAGHRPGARAVLTLAGDSR